MRLAKALLNKGKHCSWVLYVTRAAEGMVERINKGMSIRVKMAGGKRVEAMILDVDYTDCNLKEK